MSYASAVETINHTIGAHDLGYISTDDYILFRQKLDQLTNKLNALRKSILKN